MSTSRHWSEGSEAGGQWRLVDTDLKGQKLEIVATGDSDLTRVSQLEIVADW